MVNRVILIGNIGNEIELKAIGNNQTPFVRLSLATTRKVKGESQTQWHSVSLWGKLAEIAERYLSKGSRIYVEGRIEYRQYEKDGQKRYQTDIVAEQLTMLGGKEDRAEQREKQAEPVADFNDSDVPF